MNKQKTPPDVDDVFCGAGLLMVSEPIGRLNPKGFLYQNCLWKRPKFSNILNY